VQRSGMPVREGTALRSRGASVLSMLLIASPLVQWAYVSALSYFTIMEPPFTGSRGITLAMQLFFAPGNVLAIVLGVGLFLRSEWTRRIARVVLFVAVAISGWFVGLQFVRWSFDSSILLALLSLAVGATCLWYFGRPSVREEFRPREDSGIVLETAPPKAEDPYSRALVIAACGEVLFGLAAALLLVHLYFVLATRPLLDMGPGIGVTEADEFLRNILFVAFALFLAPHALTTAASIGILLIRHDPQRVVRRYALIAGWTVVAAALVAAWLAIRRGFAFDARSVQYVYLFCGALFLTTAASIGILIGRDTLRAARRHSLIACWTVVAAALVAAWLATREGFAFDARSLHYVYLFCGASFAWHAWFLYMLGHYRSAR